MINYFIDVIQEYNALGGLAPAAGAPPVAMTMYYIKPILGLIMRPAPLRGKDGSSQRAGWRRAIRLFDLVAQEGDIISREMDSTEQKE
jgi:hypothetical protein